MDRFRFLTAGESHGPMLGAIVEGVPAGLALTEEDLAIDLARRQRGYGRGARQTIEQDRARILSGVRHGRTLGSPILLELDNRDWVNWTRVMQVGPLSPAEAAELETLASEGTKRAQPITAVRPGHADLAGALKYGFDDVRNVLERSSARETAARVAAGGIARAFLSELGIEVWSFSAEVGGVAVDPARCTRSREEADASPLRCPDPDAETAMIAKIDEARSAGDTVGGVFEVVVHGAPIGLGSYVHWDRRLDAALAAAVMGINIVKGVELGLGFEQTRRFGSVVHDVIEGRRADGTWVHRTNNAGGLTGGVTNGEPIVVRGAVKPISTLARPLPTADLRTGEAVDRAHYERSDISVVPAVHDVIEGRRPDGTWVHRTNNAGGLTGGVTNGEPIVVRGAVKPISTLARPLPTADLRTGEAVDRAHYERSDISVVPAAGVIGEAMVMLTLAAFVLEKTGGDSMAEVADNLARYRARIAGAPDGSVAPREA